MEFAPFTTPVVIDAAHLERQRSWSRETFGPGQRTDGLTAHIGKELCEIAERPTALEEWVDVVILALDGAWRAGHEPQAIVDAIVAKQAENEARTWPDWRAVPEGEPIEHVRETEWALSAEDGTTMRTSEKYAIEAQSGGFTIGINRSPVVAVLARATSDDEWKEVWSEGQSHVLGCRLVEDHDGNCCTCGAMGSCKFWCPGRPEKPVDLLVALQQSIDAAKQARAEKGADRG